MFANACKFYWNLVCSVGGRSPTLEGKLHGKGCLVSPDHALTALHTVDAMLRSYKWLVVMKHDGLFKANVSLRSDDLDVALLGVEEKISDFTLPTPVGYPTIMSANPFLGLSVGFIGTISLEGETENERHITFSQASTSYYFKDKRSNGLRYALTGGFVQQGFSGCPVFTADLELVGLIVMYRRFPLDINEPRGSIYNLPIMSSLASLKKDIETILGKK
jgi:hypothetical protein